MAVAMIMAGSAIAGGLSSIFGGAAKKAEMDSQIRQQREAVRVENQRALNNWVQGNLQKTFNNSREQFQAAHNWVQQLKKNEAIDRAAYEYQWDAKQALKLSSNAEQQKLSNNLMQQQGSLLNALASRGIGTSSGMYLSMALAQTLDGLQNANRLKQNTELQASNIDKQTRQMQAQKTENVFMPNTQLYDPFPVLGTAPTSSGQAGTYAMLGGALSGAVQIGGAAYGLYQK